MKSIPDLLLRMLEGGKFRGALRTQHECEQDSTDAGSRRTGSRFWGLTSSFPGRRLTEDNLWPDSSSR
jgi:hypothetical protein